MLSQRADGNGGALGEQRTHQALRVTDVVYLRVECAEALSRVESDPRRPMWQRPDLPEIYAARGPVYEAASTMIVDTHGLLPSEVAREIAERLSASG